MSQPNYEAEVRKVYPDAWYVSFFGEHIVYRKDKSKDEMIGFAFTTKKAAWQSAYETLKKQGKI